MKKLFCFLFVFALFGCEEEEPPPTFPPEIGSAAVDCADGGDYQVVETVKITITDPDRDLVTDSIVASINGIPVTFDDGAQIDDVFEWSPPASWSPEMICRGTFRIIVSAADSEGKSSKETLEVSK